MDDERFDGLARAIAGRGSRRAAVPRLAAVAVGAFLARMGPRDTAAQRWGVPLGGSCFDDSQCDQSAVDAPFRAVCAANGFDYDGPYNCCVGDDNRCWADEHCCGGAYCLGGFCVTIPYEGFGPGGGVGSLGLGEPCGDPAQCYSGSGVEATCADNGVDPGGICCTFYGFPCASKRHCCGSLDCVGGVCTVPYEGYG